MPPVLLEPLERFPGEFALLGLLLLAYGEVENTICACVSTARDELDVVVKAMYRARGETQRIDVADALGRPVFREIGLETQFSEAIADMGHCRKIRNQFAHCSWHDDLTGCLSFINMEEIAIGNAVISNLAGLSIHYVDVPLLQLQMNYFQHLAQRFLWMNFEAQKRIGKIPSHIHAFPPKVARPPLYRRRVRHGRP